MITMGDIKKWVTATLAGDTEFTALCVATIGTSLNFYRGTPVNTSVEVLPCFTAFGSELNTDYTNNGDFPNTWHIPCALAIPETTTSVLEGDTRVYTSPDDAEILAVKAIEVLRIEARNCGINSVDIKLLSANIVVSQIGEADDIQANIFLVFGEMNHI